MAGRIGWFEFWVRFACGALFGLVWMNSESQPLAVPVLISRDNFLNGCRNATHFLGTKCRGDGESAIGKKRKATLHILPIRECGSQTSPADLGLGSPNIARTPSQTRFQTELFNAATGRKELRLRHRILGARSDKPFLLCLCHTTR
jgi:hypothetical protein